MKDGGRVARWEADTVAAALTWFATEFEVSVFTDVPVCLPSWRGWPPDVKEHYLDAVGTATEVGVVAWSEVEFNAASSSGVVLPVVARGFADRTVFGRLVAGCAMLARTYPAHGVVRPVVLVDGGKQEPNTAPVYRARGIDIVAVPAVVLS